MAIGRPMEFDPDVALDKAMQTFWAQGYEATSTTDLMSAMGLSKSSLYQTFGSKRELFIRCLDHYCREAGDRVQTIVAGTRTGKQFIVDLFRAFISAGSNGRPKGCLLVNTACEFGNSDKELGSYIASRLEGSKQQFRQAIEQGQRDGDIPADKDADQLSNLLVMNVCGLRVLAKLETDPSVMESTVDQLLEQLD